MHADFLDRYSRLHSPVHRLPVGVKLLSALVLVVGMAVCPLAWALWLLGPAVLLLLVAAISEVPWRYVLGRLLMLEPFVAAVALLALFGPGGWRLFVLLVVRCTLCLLAMILLASTTPFGDLLEVLRKMRVPGLLVTTLALMYRYLFVLVDESQRMRRARASRTFVSDKRRTWRGLAAVVGQLFVRASVRAERVYAAMCARGWR